LSPAVETADMSVIQVDPSLHLLPRYKVISKIAGLAAQSQTVAALELLVAYVGASHFLLAREDQLKEAGLNFIISSDWPFDLVRRIAADLVVTQSRVSEMEKCLSLLKPRIVMFPEDVSLPSGVDRQYCLLAICAGRVRYMLFVMFPENAVPSDDRLREVGLLTGYFASTGITSDARDSRDIDLTDRELECLFWIAEGKTSDEMATILGISRNTINNYITSVMRKTATKTRSEAIAYAVRNNLV
jgi:DNA-binding CsgD family transcriptional regulator